MSRKNRRSNEVECAYCGTFGKVTADHVIPRCLFEKPLPPDIVTVPACDSCNNEKSKDDGYLRDLVVTDASTSNHPIAKSIFLEKSLSALRQNKSELLRDAIQTVRRAELYTQAGIYIGDAHVAPLDNERLDRVIGRIVRGLYYKIHGTRIPSDYEFGVVKWDITRLSAFDEYASSLLPILNGPYRCGEALECYTAYGDENPFITCWLLIFYGGIRFTVTTAPPVEIDSEHRIIRTPAQ